MMKKFIFFIPVIFLIIATTLTKDSTKKLDKKIFELKENIRVLEDKHELILLDYNVLTSPKKLMEYQKLYFDDVFIQKNLENLNWIVIKDNVLHLESLKNNQ